MTPLGIPRWFSPWRHWRRFCFLLVALFLLRGVFVLCVLPPLEGWDEYQHLAYVVHMDEQGEAPRFRESHVSKRLLEAIVAYPQCEHACGQDPRYGAVSYQAFWSLTERPAPLRPIPDVGLYQSQHSPLYYRLAAPLFRLAGGLENVGTSLFVLRLANLLLGALALIIALWGARRWIRHPVAAAVVGVVVALHPLYLLNTCRVSSDALGLVLGTWVVVWCLAFDARRAWRHGLALGLLLGLAVLAKTVNLILAPFAVFCLLMVATQGRASWGRVIVAGLLLVAGAAAVTHGYFWQNLTLYGTPTAMQETILNKEAGRGFDALLEVIGGIDWADRLHRLWIVDQVWVGGWSYLGPPDLTRDVYAWVFGIAVAGPLAAWVWPRLRAPAALTRDAHLGGKLFVLCLLFTAGIFFHQAQYALRWDGRLPCNPWYAASAFPAFLALVSMAGFAWPVRGVRFVVPLALAAVFAWMEVVSVFEVMVPAYANLPAGDEAFARLASLRPALFGTTTMKVSLGLAGATLLLALLAIAAGRAPARRAAP